MELPGVDRALPRLGIRTKEGYMGEGGDDDGASSWMPQRRGGSGKDGALANLFLMSGGPGGFEIFKLPRAWLDHMNPGSVRLAWQGPSSTVHLGRCRLDNKFWVAIKAVETGTPAMQRELHIRKRLATFHESGLAPAGQIIPTLSYDVHEQSTFFLFPACEVSLKQLMDSRRKTEPLEPGRPLLPPELSLLMVIDLLRGLKNLEQVGVLHNALTEANVMVSDSRAFISDFSSACLMYEDEDGSSCVEVLDGQPTMGRVSPYRLAPEMVGGVPTGHANSIWSVGLILARLGLGYLPTLPEGQEFTDDEIFMLDEGEKGQKRMERIQSHIAKEFDIEKAAGFAKAPGYIQELLRHMLAKAPEKRWSAERALKYALEAASDNMIFVPEEVDLPRKLPAEWTATASTG